MIIKKYLKGSKIRINTKNNQSIWDIFGGQSLIYGQVDENDIIEENFDDFEPDKGKEEETNIDIINKPNNIKEDTILTIRKEPSKRKINEKALEEEFIKVFEQVNDDFIFVGPKLIPIIPGDDTSVLNNASEYCDEI